ncbi:Hpt domain-containing protein [Ruegeria sp. SCPT10]|uniref:Hpt domain-containing protein n=1 Tax=Ruegeria sp. SCP10 TaxID=3141377 RepID=UPI0033378967
MSKEAKLNDALTQVRSKFVVSCQERSQTLLEAMRALETELDQPEALAQVRRECHKLAGLAGSIGFTEIGNLAEVIDTRLKEGRAGWVVIEPMVKDLLQRLEGIKK